MAIAAGFRIGKYEIVRLVGAGGMGEVYEARDLPADRTVALKVLPESAAADPELCARFLREGRAASRLTHPSITRVYDIGAEGRILFIAMELVRGESLEARLADYVPLSTSELVEIASQLAEALSEAHAKGIIHRDIKPANVIVTPQGQAKLLDFGIAKVLHKPGERATVAPTAEGLVMGSANYMSPEQALGKTVDHRSDLFSLGGVMYEMATGHRPFEGGQPAEVIGKVIGAQPDAIAGFNREVPPEIVRIIGKCLEKDPARRYQCAGELLADLRNWTGAPSPAAVRSPRRNWIFALAAAAGLAGAVALWLFALR